MIAQSNAVKRAALFNFEVKAGNLRVIRNEDGTFRVVSYEWYEIAHFNIVTREARVRRSARNYSPSTGRQIQKTEQALKEIGFEVEYIFAPREQSQLEDELLRRARYDD